MHAPVHSAISDANMSHRLREILNIAITVKERASSKCKPPHHRTAGNRGPKHRSHVV